MQRGADADAQADVDDLVRGAQRGDASCVAALYEHYFDKIFRYVSFRVGGDVDAEDITGDVFVRMLESIHSFKWRGFPFSSWLFRIAHNRVVDHYRKSSRKKTVPLESASATAGQTSADIDALVDLTLSAEQVQSAMVDLTRLQREVISLRFAGGLSVAETARAVGKRENAVKALQHAGLRKLRRILEARARDKVAVQGKA